MELPEIKPKKAKAAPDPAAPIPVNPHKLHDFYTIRRERGGDFKEIAINKVKFVAKLMELGFRRFDLSVTDSKYIRIENNTIEEVSEKTITDTFLSYVEGLPDLDHPNGDEVITITAEIIKAKFYNNLENYFKPALFNRMRNPIPIFIKEDTAKEKFFFFSNVWIEVSAGGWIVKDYGELNGYIWKSQILPRSFVMPDERSKESYFEIFCRNISGKDPARIKSLQSIIGYNLHAWFSGKLKATILTDSRISADGEANGRTGKGIICKALSYMLNADPKRSSVYVRINGREYNPKNINKHADCNLDTKLLHIEDIYDNYNLENSFNDITDGLSVRKLFQSAFSIVVKIIFSTNKTIIIEGESAKDRVIQFELADYYNSNFDPSQEFKHWFFDDWNAKEFNRFDLYMFECVRLYLAEGLKEAEAINLRIRTLHDHTAHEFINLMDDLLTRNEAIRYKVSKTSDLEETISIKTGEPVLKSDLFTAFRRINEDYDNNRFKQKTFTKWVKFYCRAFNIGLEEKRTNGKDLFIFKLSNQNQ